ncbi:MAG: 30S ribosomal protein S3 [Dehalococcoidia bacterium]|nr:30S ribosomal protein S3 [Dehalococcoidia bacterium]
MGQKIHPHGFRLGYIYDWESKWFAEREYTQKLHEDLRLRQFILDLLPDASISRVEIDRNANQLTVTIHTGKPGIVIGRGGAKVEELRGSLEKLTGARVRVNIQEIRTPELDAYLVARSIADQIERRVAFRRAIKQAAQRTMQRGANGVRISIAGRLGGAEMSRNETETAGRVPRHTLRADIDYGLAEANTTYGQIGVKAWIYKGDIIPDVTTGRGADLDIEEAVPQAPAAPAAPAQPEPQQPEPEPAPAAPASTESSSTISMEQQEQVRRESQQGDS